MMKVALFICLGLLCVISAASAGDLRLIAFSETHKEWLSTEDIEKLIINKVKFMDITDHQGVNAAAGPVVTADPFPNQPNHKIQVEALATNIDQDQVEANLNYLSNNFFTRYYTSATGASAAQWIQGKFKEYIGSREGLTAELYTHSWAQPSVVATIPGWGPHKEQIVVIGGHEDSVGSSTTGRSPGADDDGTGTVSVLEIFRVLVAADFRPDRTIQFFTYAGEEAGLLGSQAIANAYRTAAKPVHAVLQLDMTGYGGEADNLAVVTDFTDANLTSFVKILVDTYSLLGWQEMKCGYGCSDHASWNRAGYRASFPFERPSLSNPYIHSQNDIVSHISFERMIEFIRVGLAFAVELADTVIEK